MTTEDFWAEFRHTRDETARLRARIAELEARQVTDAETIARAEAEFDGRPWLAMPKADRERYVARVTAALAVAGTGDGSQTNGVRPMDEIKPVAIHPLYAGNLRHQMQEWTEAERAIHAAMAAVERFPGGSLHLTNATILLAQARQAVARHILSAPPAPKED